MNSTIALDTTAVPRISHREAMQIAAVENGRFATLLRSRDARWSPPSATATVPP